MLDVTLHFGAHRTATTTFQRMIGQSRGGLAAKGYAYWGPKRTRSDLFEGLIGPARPALSWVNRRQPHVSRRVTDALDGLAADGTRQLLVSEENMVGTLRHTLSHRCLYPDAGGRARRLAGTFGPHCRQLAFGIRSYDAWWASAVAFCVARSGPVPSAQLSAALVDQPRRWRHVITELAATFPDARICVWTHEMMSARPEVLARALLGPDLPRLSGRRDWHNAAPTPAALRSHLADMGQSSEGVIEQTGRFMPFNASQRRALQAQYAEDIAWLRSGADGQAIYIDDLGEAPGATGPGRGQANEGYAQNRRLA